MQPATRMVRRKQGQGGRAQHVQFNMKRTPHLEGKNCHEEDTQKKATRKSVRVGCGRLAQSWPVLCNRHVINIDE
jgi:hypothetical protein